ncbi:MAG: hypothetical protein HQK81_11945 [Desulfovibrionaceae bacterium]|nr:hypothetical protein [Desulfovibrionaceae bacterium]MBF0514754.1 hypothetical protein [Desulfovibrionaceae bacterium]
MDLTSFKLLGEAFAFAFANRRQVLAVALFPFCAIALHTLTFTFSPWFLALNLLILLLLAPFKIDLFRLFLLGEKPEGNHAGRLFRRRELKFFLYEVGLTFFICGLLIVAWLIAMRAGETWETVGAPLRLGSAVSVGLLLGLAFYCGLPAMLFFPSLSLDRNLPLTVLFNEARPYRARIFFTVFWTFAVFFMIAAVLPQLPAASQGAAAGPALALAIALLDSCLSLAANIVITLAVAAVFKHSVMTAPQPRITDKDLAA